MAIRHCYYCGKERPDRKPRDWSTLMGWRGPKGKKKLYVLYAWGDHYEGMQDAWWAYTTDEWKPKHERA